MNGKGRHSSLRSAARGRRATAADGSALLMVLLVMVLLAAMSLPLIFVTQTEMLLGGTERVITDNFYAAESGAHAALAAVLVTQDWQGEEFATVSGSLGPERLIGHRVSTSRVQAVGPPQTPPLTIANVGENDYHTFSVVLTSVAQRVSWPAGEPAPLYESGDPRENDVTIQAQTVQSVNYLLSPIKAPASPGSLYGDGEVIEIY
jgi:hypothetical protein